LRSPYRRRSNLLSSPSSDPYRRFVGFVVVAFAVFAFTLAAGFALPLEAVFGAA